MGGQAVVLTDGVNGRNVRVGPQGSLETIDFVDHAIDSGDCYSVSHIYNTIEADKSGDFIIRVGALPLKARFKFAVDSGDLRIGLYEDPTVYALGEEVAPQNMNRQRPDTIVSSFYHTNNC